MRPITRAVYLGAIIAAGIGGLAATSVSWVAGDDLEVNLVVAWCSVAGFAALGATLVAWAHPDRWWIDYPVPPPPNG
ncbi:MAG TPA: hypothetical protein VFF67_10395 [Thermoplasmata archaeon]|nr:hypothetical protein [Thermoplasmata archaeon]